MNLRFILMMLKRSKCSGSFNNISDPCAKLCIPNVSSKYMNGKLFHLISRTNKTRYIKWYEPGRCKYRVDASVCNNKHRRNRDKCRCEFEELFDNM